MHTNEHAHKRSQGGLRALAQVLEGYEDEAKLKVVNLVGDLWQLDEGEVRMDDVWLVDMIGGVGVLAGWAVGGEQVSPSPWSIGR